MLQLKDIANRMEVHPRTAKRWWRKLDAECEAAGLPRVHPDVIGHGPHRWHDATADRLILMWENYFSARGTSPALHCQKFAGQRSDDSQLNLLTYRPRKIFNGFPPQKRRHKTKRSTTKN